MTQQEYAEKVLRKPIRTKAGVTPLTVVCKPRKCNHGTCIYCPGGDDVPQSYTNKSPAIMRAMKIGYNAKKQVLARLDALKAMHHPTEKIELIIIGGTFMQYPKKYRDEFIKDCYDALNQKDSKDLDQAKKINETAEHRCVALCVENRPDDCSEKQVKEMLDYGATRIEMGVQVPDNEIYKKINRGHTVQDVIDATKNLKDAGFKIGYHFMPGLPYSNKQKDLKLFKELFSNQNFKPDQLKIYPCQIIADSPLEKIYKKINYQPYSKEEITSLVEEMYKEIPNYCRVMRIMRQIPPEKIISKATDISLREQVEKNLRNSHTKINEIRMREAGLSSNKDSEDKLTIKETTYTASDKKEMFLECINNENILFGLLRLRFLDKDNAIIRELHVYGNALDLKEKSDNSAQHKGIGKLLMQKAEQLAIKNNSKKIKVISGIGVREYYKKLGYSLDKEKIYMERRF